MMWQYWRKKPIEILGLDIGSTTIKMVHLKIIPPEYFVKAYVYVPIQIRSKDTVHFDTIQALKIAKAKLNTTCKDVIIAIPDVKVFSQLVLLDTAASDWKTTALLKTAPYIPSPLDTVYVDSQKISNSLRLDSQSSPFKVLTVACPQDIVNNYLYMVKASGLRTQIIEVESHALERTCYHFYVLDHYPKLWALVEIGLHTMTILLWKKNQLLVTGSAYLCQPKQSSNLVTQVLQELARLSLANTTDPLESLHIIGGNPYRSIVEQKCRHQLRLQPHTHTFSPKTPLPLSQLTYMHLAMGLSLRHPSLQREEK